MTNKILLPTQAPGLWVERGASSDLIDLALGQVPKNSSFATDKAGYNTWHYWAQGSRPEILWEYLRLIHEGNYDHACSHSGEHPLYRLLIRGHREAANLWMSEAKWPAECKKGDNTLWHAAAWSGDSSLLENMSTHVSTQGLNDKDEEGLTAAIIATHRGGREALMHWMFLGAEPNILDAHGRSILHHVAIYGDISWFTEIQDMGADDKLKNDKNQTPRDVLTERMRHSTQADLDMLKRHWTKKYQDKISF